MKMEEIDPMDATENQHDKEQPLPYFFMYSKRKVKQENDQVEIKHENPPPLHPWSSVVDMSDPTPWYFPKIPKNEKFPPTGPEKSLQGKQKRRVLDDKKVSSVLLTSKEVPRIQSKNYSAIEKHGRFGLIDMGIASPGVRCLTLHIPKSRNFLFPLNNLKVGDIINVIKRDTNESLTLCLCFTTPSRYYSPGTRITTLTIGVDERAWSKVSRH